MLLQKSIVIFHIIFLMIPTTHAQQFRILGHLEGRQNGYVYLYYKDATGNYVNDSSAIQKGKFLLTGNILGPVRAYLTCNIGSLNVHDPYIISFLLEPKTLYFRGNACDLTKAVISASE